MKRKGKSLLALVLCLMMILSAAMVPASAVAQANAWTAIEGLTVNYDTNPIGIETGNLRFGWKMDSNQIGQAQSAYQIIVSGPDGQTVWDSGKVADSRSTAIAYEGPQLALETRYTWSVTVTAADGKAYVSEPAFFETGCNWDNAQWISIENYQSTMNSLLFRTEQPLSGDQVVSARLYITGLGAYEAYLNGREVQGEKNSILAPGWSDYSSYIHYQTYDVTDYLPTDGQPVVLGAVVGSGWYGSSIVKASAIGYDKVVGDGSLLERCLYAKLVITYADGTSQEIVTDPDTWQVSSQSPYQTDGIYEGEVYDATAAKAVEGWSAPGYDASGWSKAAALQYQGNVIASSDGLIYDYQQLPLISAYAYNASTGILTAEQGSAYAQGEVDFRRAVSYRDGDVITLKAGDTLIADFGQNAAAAAAISVSAPAGTVVTMQPGEALSDGRDGVYPKGALIPGACEGRGFGYIACGDGVETYRAQFHFTGYQYLRITADQDITIHSLSSIAVSSLEKETGFVETSNALLNRFILNSKWSQLSNYNSVPTDCPHREYYGWSGDAQLFAESAMYHFDSAKMLGNYIAIMDDYQQTYGNYGQIMPMHTNSFFSKLTGAGWTDAGIIVPWVYYQQTGDLSLIREYWAGMCKYTDAIASRGHSFSLGDWCGIGESSGTPITAQFYNIYINQLMSKMAGLLGDEEACARYAQNAENRRQATIAKYVTKEGDVLSASADNAGEGFVDNAQTALAWAIKLKLYNTEEQRQAIVSNLAKSVRNENQSVSAIRGENTLATGFLGVNVLLPALSEGGESGAAFDLMTNDDLYTFLYSVSHGATSIWETWSLWTEESGYDVSNVSQNHYSYGAASEWVYEYLLGIQKDEDHPAFEHFILQPEADSSLTDASGSYDSYYGLIESGWTAEDGVMTSYSAVVPANTTATLYLPVKAADVAVNTTGAQYVGDDIRSGRICAKFELQSGGYDFAIENGVVTVNLADGYVDDNAPVQSASAPESAQVGFDFDVTVVTSASVTDVKLYNEFDLAIGAKNVAVAQNDDGTKTWTITVSVGTVGDRTFKVVTKGSEDYLMDSGVTVSIEITSIAPVLSSFDLPDTAVVNRTFIVKATTDMAATKINVYNEFGTKMGIQSLSYKVVDGQKVWTGVMAIGTKGDRTFTATAVNKYGAPSEALTDSISVKAFASSV